MQVSVSEWASEAWPTIEGTPVSSQDEHREHGTLTYFGMTSACLSSSLRTLAVTKYQAPRLACLLPSMVCPPSFFLEGGGDCSSDH